MRISDWSSDVCSSDLLEEIAIQTEVRNLKYRRILILVDGDDGLGVLHAGKMLDRAGYADGDIDFGSNDLTRLRSEEQTSELQSLMRTLYAVFCLIKKRQTNILYSKYVMILSNQII